jgi:hypothetical protein
LHIATSIGMAFERSNSPSLLDILFGIACEQHFEREAHATLISAKSTARSSFFEEQLVKQV